MIKVFLSVLLSFLAISVTADTDAYSDYLAKIFPQSSAQSHKVLEASPALTKWFEDLDKLLDSDKLETYKGYFNFELDERSNIETLEIVSLEEKDFDKFKDFVAQISALDFPDCDCDLTGTKFSLEAQSLYVDRPDQGTAYLKASINKDLDTKIENISDDFVLHKPKYLDYPYIGQEIILKNTEDVFLKTYVTEKKASKLSLNAFQAYDDDESMVLDFDFELKRKGDKNFVAKLMRSGFANGLKAGILTSYQTYGIAPGALAIMGMTGTALIENETEDSFSLQKGEILKIKKADK